MVCRRGGVLAVAVLGLTVAGGGCGKSGSSVGSGSRPARARSYPELRKAMVKQQIVRRGVRDERVLAAMRKVPRHRFVPARARSLAYEDTPIGIGHEQTISQPYIVAFMTEALRLKPDYKVLEIGTGSGYQAAVLAELVKEVYTIEIVAALGRQAKRRLAKLGHRNVKVRIGDGYRGWPQAAPFDAIMVTAAPDHVPQPLIGQLRVGGHLVMPVGKEDQKLVRLTRTASGVKREELLLVRFVPMTGRAKEGR